MPKANINTFLFAARDDICSMHGWRQQSSLLFIQTALNISARQVFESIWHEAPSQDGPQDTKRPTGSMPEHEHKLEFGSAAPSWVAKPGTHFI